MDLQELARRALRDREIDVEIEGRHFTLRLPTEHERKCALLRLVPEVRSSGEAENAELSAAQLLEFTRGLLLKALVGWDEKVTLRDVLRGEDVPPEPLPWSPPAVELLLDARPRWEKDLRQAFRRALEDRGDLIEGDRKN